MGATPHGPQNLVGLVVQMSVRQNEPAPRGPELSGVQRLAL